MAVFRVNILSASQENIGGMAVYAQVDKRTKTTNGGLIPNVVVSTSSQNGPAAEDRAGRPGKSNGDAAFYSAGDPYEDINTNGQGRVEETVIEDHVSLQSEISQSSEGESISGSGGESTSRGNSPELKRGSGEFRIEDAVWSTVPADNSVDYEETITTRF